VARLSYRRLDVAGFSIVLDRWLEESRDRMLERTVERSPIAPELEERFEALRVAMQTELGRQIDAAVGRMQLTFEQEIEALRTMNREEAKRLRAANGEAFVRIRASDTQELERIRGAIDEGIERLCSILEGQLDRVWSANDVELERIHSAGADRLAEVHDLLMFELDRVRGEAAAPARRWFGRKGRTSAD
jgi:hypothetical protein